ncbi:MAG: hypothetical protein J0M13_18015 [Candidatus Accumulibacter sp.]|nr:hypothetical protein [Candidatus Accumulibacter necessarius]
MGQEHEIRLDEMNLQNPADSLVEERLRAKTLADLPVGRTPALGNMKCMHGRYKAAAAGFTAFQP